MNWIVTAVRIFQILKLKFYSSFCGHQYTSTHICSRAVKRHRMAVRAYMGNKQKCRETGNRKMRRQLICLLDDSSFDRRQTPFNFLQRQTEKCRELSFRCVNAIDANQINVLHTLCVVHVCLLSHCVHRDVMCRFASEANRYACHAFVKNVFRVLSCDKMEKKSKLSPRCTIKCYCDTLSIASLRIRIVFVLFFCDRCCKSKGDIASSSFAFVVETVFVWLCACAPFSLLSLIFRRSITYYIPTMIKVNYIHHHIHTYNDGVDT